VFHDFEQPLDSGGDCTGEFIVLSLQGENLRSGLNLLCLVMSLLKAMF
jgi:hypothetical protein